MAELETFTFSSEIVAKFMGCTVEQLDGSESGVPMQYEHILAEMAKRIMALENLDRP